MLSLKWVLSHFSHGWLFETLWTASCQPLLSLGSSRQEYWSGLPCPPPEDFPSLEIKPMSLMSPALAGRFFTTGATWGAVNVCVLVAQLCPTPCDPLDCSSPGSSVHGIFPRQEYWNGLPFPSSEELPNPGTEPGYPALQADSLPSVYQGSW